jgi:N-hydroxyarylamine O-acetyltransferase
MDVKQYLERINIKTIQRTNYSFLAHLQLNHLMAVPFENLDIRQGIRIALDEKSFYEKIVHRHRGGFCYELNGLFRWLLAELGFSVSLASGRVYIASDHRFSPEFDHMVLLVQMDKTFLVDVGFGDCFRKPLELPDGSEEDVSGIYRIVPPLPDQDVYLLKRKNNDKWQAVYSFTLHPRQLKDFSEMFAFNQTSPNSHFTRQTVCSAATERGRVTLSEDSLTVTEGHHLQKKTIDSREMFQQLLTEIFEISLDVPPVP